MPRQNRVTPYGELVAVDARGTFMGNRGCLHDADGVIRRSYQGKRWIICVLSFKGRRQAIMAPGHYTQVFFTDEATALAAGHRPCAECQRQRFQAYRAAWARGNPAQASSARPGADEIDAALHAERLTAQGRQMTFTADLAELPDGCFVTIEGETAPFLVFGAHLLRWAPAGYDLARPRPARQTVAVLTPQSTARALGAGYMPVLHPTAYSLITREG